MSESTLAPEHTEHLEKKLTFWHVWALGVGAVVGDGIFLMVAQGATVAGPAALVSYLATGILLGIVCMAISELSVAIPGAGSLHLWSERVLGPAWGVLAALGEVVMNIVFLGTVTMASGSFGTYFFQFGSDPMISSLIWAVIFLTFVLVICLSGGEFTGKTQLIMVGLLIVIMVAFSVAGFLSGQVKSENFTPFAPFGISGIWAALGMGVYAFLGPMTLLTASGELKDPNSMPKIMFWTFVMILVLYVTAMAVMLGIVSYTQYGVVESPFALAASVVFGGAAGQVVNFAAWLAAVTCLIGEVFSPSRLLYGMAIDGVVPAVFAKLNSKKVPWVGMVVAYVIALVFVFGAFLVDLESFYVVLGMVACVLGSLTILISLVSSMLYKHKFPEEYAKLAWRLPVRWIMYPLSFIGTLLLIYSILESSHSATIYTSIVTIGLILVFYRFYSLPKLKAEHRS